MRSTAMLSIVRADNAIETPILDSVSYGSNPMSILEKKTVKKFDALDVRAICQEQE